jgi:PTS system mannose-specific IIA component
VTGMNLGLVMSLSFLNLTSNKENNRRVINEAIEETKNGMYLVEDMFNTMDEITDDGDL